MRSLRRTISFMVVIVVTAGTMAVGIAVKSPCASGNWSDQRQYLRLCYSDIVPLLYTEQLDHNRLPFIQHCAPHPDNNCDEYPVLTMYFMRITAWISGPVTARFYFLNALLLLACAVVVSVCLARLCGSKALMFALAPTLLLYGTMNWDLLAVALSTWAMLAFFRRRDGWAGGLLGLGAAAKAYPGMFAVPLAAQRLRERSPDGSIVLFWTAAFTWIAVNLPFAVVSPSAWWEFFRFNATRISDFDSLWYMTCSRLHLCPSTHAVNYMSLGLFVLLLAAAWAIKARLHPGFPIWTLGFPMVVLFLLTNKVYSPQYGLWLLPWFALALPDIWAWAAFELADGFVFVTRFHWFAAYPAEGTAWTKFEIAIWVRAAILAVTLVLWILWKPKPLAIERHTETTTEATPQAAAAAEAPA